MLGLMLILGSVVRDLEALLELLLWAEARMPVVLGCAWMILEEIQLFEQGNWLTFSTR